MALTWPNRKVLWALSGGVCAICKRRLTEDPTEADGPVVIGMEAHIVSEKPNGPRHRPFLDDFDHPDNLILLCPNDHAIVDKQDNSYTEEELRRIKEEHQRWVRQRLAPSQRIRVRDPAAGKPMVTELAMTGGRLMSIIGGCHAMKTGEPDPLSDEEIEILAPVLQNVFDWSELWDGLGPGERLRAEQDVTRDLNDLLQAGFVVYAGARPQVLEGGEKGPSHWQLGVVFVERGGLDPRAGTARSVAVAPFRVPDRPRGGRPRKTSRVLASVEAGR